MKKRPVGRPNHYDFTALRKTKWTDYVDVDVLNCRSAARYYARVNKLRIVTRSPLPNMLEIKII